MYKIKEENMLVPAYIWSAEGSIEHGATNQIKRASCLPFAFHHTVLCPDGHEGFGAPIGGVLAAKGVIVPAFVGVDIGCGMRAVRTSIRVEDMNVDLIKKILGGSKENKGGIRSNIPTGFSHHTVARFDNFMPELPSDVPVVDAEYVSARKQIGTLGGGNHFIELQKGDDGHVWFMIHSGSRNLGFKVANEYNKQAIEMNETYYSQVPKNWELAFFPMHYEQGKRYLREMQYCLDFAKANRQVMSKVIKEAILTHVPDAQFEEDLDVHHNYATMENHFGSNVMVHRKGATSAKEGQLGIIPGSQGSKSYIVKGLGNPDSFTSCSHGAGRKMSRTKAKLALNLAEEIKKMDDLGVVHGIRNQNDLDEAAGAYKDIDEVMANQADLVEIVTCLQPMAVVKG